MSKYLGNLDLTGQVFGRLTVIRKVPQSRSRWLCKCICGNEKEVIASQLLNGYVRSCGCLEKENIEHLPERTIKHGMTNTILYKKWCGMKYRCFNSDGEHFDRYGGRGITVCEEWLGDNGFENFAKWAYSVGYNDNLHGYEQTLDRIDVNGNYEPDNCRWVNQLVQSRNKSNNFLVEDVDKEQLTVKAFDEKHNITADMFSYRRFKKGYSAKQIIDEWNAILEVKKGLYYTREEAADFYGVHIRTIEQWVNKRWIESRKVGFHTFIKKGQQRPITDRMRMGRLKERK